MEKSVGRTRRAVAWCAAAAALFLGACRDGEGVSGDPGLVDPGPPDNGGDGLGGAEVCVSGTAKGLESKGLVVVSCLSATEIQANYVNDVWGWTDAATGVEWALVGHADGISFVSLEDPESPVHVGSLPLTEGANRSIWRDVKVYRDHAYVVADGAGSHGMQVFDLTALRDVESSPDTFEATTLYTKIASAHNVAINEETGYAYSVGGGLGGETCGGGLHMIDIRAPAAPEFAGCFADSRTGSGGSGYTHDAMCVVYRGPDVEHRGKEVCFGSNETALSIADVSDKSAPAALSHATYPNVGYAHQGWIDEDHEYFYMNDEMDEMNAAFETRTLVWDVRDLDDPLMVKEHFASTDATDHNLYVVGDLLYQSNYAAGLRVLDVSNRVAPVEVAYLDTTPHDGFSGTGAGSWSNYPFFASGIVAVTSMGEGVFFVKVAAGG